MATKSKKKQDNESAKTKAKPSVGVSSKNSSVKKKEKIHHSQVSKKTKKKVSSKHPLAKANKINPSGMDVEVDDSVDDVLDENDILESEVKDNFDIESISDQSVSPSDSSDDIIPLAQTASESTLKLEVPITDTLTQQSYKFVSMPDGTQRVAVSLSFDDVFRADQYEVRISS